MKLKFINLIKVSILILTSIGCTKNKIETQNNEVSIIKDISRKNDFSSSIIYDNNNPVLIKQETDFRKSTSKITYNLDKISKISFEQQIFNQIESIEYEVKYLNDFEVEIVNTKSKSVLKLKFNDFGLVDKITKFSSSDLKSPIDIENYYYNTENNLIKIEYLKDDKVYNFESFDKYDTKNNPFFEKAKTWTIIRKINDMNLGTYMSFPISKNNPSILTLRDNNAGNRLIYTYNSNNLPAKIKEYIYKKGGTTPPIESDYFLEDEFIIITY